MKRDLFAVLVLVAAVATAMPCSNAAADDNAAGPMGGLGFRSTDAPIWTPNRVQRRARQASPSSVESERKWNVRAAEFASHARLIGSA